MKKLKTTILLSLLLLILTLSTTCFATTTSSEKATMTIVENNVCTIQVNDFVNFEKKIIASDMTKKELTIQLKIENTAEEVFAKPTEIFLVIDNSLSMKEEIATDVTRLSAITTSAKTLATELLKNENVKIGVVSFSSSDQEGTLSDAQLLLKPSASLTDVTTKIDAIASGEFGIRTNIDAGLTIANQNFSEDCESKYLVLLTDGVPNNAVDGPTLTYSGETATKTKAKLQTLDANGVQIFSLMTGVMDVAEPSTGISYKLLAEEIFGTTEEPTVGKFYYITDDEIEETVSQTILDDITDTTQTTLHNLDIYDYFPQEIVDNFDFSYVTSPTLGTVSPTIDLENRCIIWHIDTLEPASSGLLSYKLTLKSTIDTTIIDKVLPTNQKVEITSEDIVNDDGSHVVSSDVSPKVKISIEEEPIVENNIIVNVEDNTIANITIPQTGDRDINYLFLGIAIIISSVIGFRWYHLNKKMK